MWVEFVVGYLLCSERFFFRYSGFPLSSKTKTFPNSNSTRNQVDEEPLCECATSKSLFILLYFILNVLSHVRFRRIDVRCNDTAKVSYENNLDIELYVGKNERCPL